MLSPCLMKNTGSRITKPSSSVLMVIRQIEPTMMRDSSGSVNKVPRSLETVTVDTVDGAAGRPCAVSR